MDLIVGIDPGLDGAFVVMTRQGEMVDKYLMPTIVHKVEKRVRAKKDDPKKKYKKGEMITKVNDKTEPDIPGMQELFRGWQGQVEHVFMEKIQAMPGNGGVGLFKFGRLVGILETLLAVYQLPHTLIHPAQWMKQMHVGISKEMESKDRSKIVAQRLFPNVDLRRSELAKGPHDGICDALLIAEWGRRYLGGTQ